MKLKDILKQNGWKEYKRRHYLYNTYYVHPTNPKLRFYLQCNELREGQKVIARLPGRQFIYDEVNKLVVYDNVVAFRVI